MATWPAGVVHGGEDITSCAGPETGRTHSGWTRRTLATYDLEKRMSMCGLEKIRLMDRMAVTGCVEEVLPRLTTADGLHIR